MQHVKSALMVAVICFIVIALTSRVEFLKKIAYPAA